MSPGRPVSAHVSANVPLSQLFGGQTRVVKHTEAEQLAYVVNKSSI